MRVSYCGGTNGAGSATKTLSPLIFKNVYYCFVRDWAMKQGGILTSASSAPLCLL